MANKPEATYPMKLTVEARLYDEPTEFDDPESQIKLILSNPQNFFDRHQTLLRMLGTSKSYKYITVGRLLRYSEHFTLAYEESVLLGMSGEHTLFHFSADIDKRSLLMLERPGKGMRIALSSEQCMANTARDSVSPFVFTTLVHRMENTLTERGGSLFVDYEASMYGNMLGRVTFDIKASPTSDDPSAYDSDDEPNAPLYLGKA